MRRRLAPALVTLAALAFLALLVFGIAGQGTASSIDAEVADGKRPAVPHAREALPDLGSPGRTSVASLRGKVVLVNVFASWCDPCKAEAPLLAAAQRTLVAHGGTVLGVTYLDTSSNARQFVHAQHVDYPVVRDVGGDFVRAFGTTGVPETFVIDRRGRIAAVRRFQLDQAWIDRTLPSLLAEPAS